jgi:CheY-like chemotaxis protein
MSEPFLDILRTYLAPFLLAIPLAVVVILIVFRRGDDERLPRRRETLPTAPPPAAMPSACRRSRLAPTAAPRLPLPPAAPPPAARPGPPAVLVVDDSAVARAKLRRLFETAGYRVEVAGDGHEALEVLAARPVDVLVTDLEMPNMDGVELIAAVQGSLETEDLPIIAITGHDELHARVHDVTGLYGLFKKPWNDRELLKRVSTLAKLGA